MYTPKVGSPDMLLWFISGIVLTDWNRYDSQRSGTMGYMMTVRDAWRDDQRPEETYSPDYRRQSSTRRTAYLN